jgi:hypothetical protein
MPLGEIHEASPRGRPEVHVSVLSLLRVSHHDYLENPPFEQSARTPSYGGLDDKREYALSVLPGGVDVSWAHYTRSGNIVSLSVVCCPNIHHSGLSCPLNIGPNYSLLTQRDREIQRRAIPF